MINSIQITNFQSHADTRIDLSDGVTALVGSSNSGKTSILRSERWVRKNRPRGTAFIRDGEDSVEVIIKSGTHTITRRRNKKLDQYEVDGGIHTALSGNVPSQVNDILNIQDINVSSQLDGHFLVLDSPGKIASAINSVVHLSEAESVIDRIRTDIRRAGQDIKSIEEQQEAQNSILNKYYRLDEYKYTLDVANSVQANLVTNRASLIALDKLLDEIDVIDKQIEKGGLPEGIEDCLNEVEVTRLLLNTHVEHRKKLRRLLDELIAIPEPVDFTELEKQVEVVSHALEDLKYKRTRLTELENLHWDINEFDSQLRIMNQKLTADETLLDSFGICPTCGQVIGACDE